MGIRESAEEALLLRHDDSPRPLFEDVLPLIERWQNDLMQQAPCGVKARAEAMLFTSRALDWLLQARCQGLLRTLEGDEALEAWQCDETQLEAEISAWSE